MKTTLSAEVQAAHMREIEHQNARIAELMEQVKNLKQDYYERGARISKLEAEVREARSDAMNAAERLTMELAQTNHMRGKIEVYENLLGILLYTKKEA